MNTEQQQHNDYDVPEFPEFGWAFRLDELRHHKTQQRFKADSDQLKELTTYLELHSLQVFDIELMVKPKRSNAYFDIYLKLVTNGAQSCVATAEAVSFDKNLAETINVTVERPQAGMGEVQLNEVDLDGPEYVENGKFDPLRFALEMLLLELEPYPRLAGADPVNEQDLMTKDDVKPNPFADLSALKDKLH